MEQQKDEKKSMTPSEFFPCLSSSREDFLLQNQVRHASWVKTLKVVFLLFYAALLVIWCFSNRYSDSTGTSVFIVFALVGALALVVLIFLFPFKESPTLWMVDKSQIERLNETPETPIPEEKKTEAPSLAEGTHPLPKVPQEGGPEEAPSKEEPPFAIEQRTLEQRAGDLQAFFTSSGWTMPLSEARNLLASLASSHLLLLEDMPEELRYPFFATLTSFFAAEPYFQGDASSWKNEEDCFYFLTSEGERKKTAFLKGLLASKENPERFSFVGVDHLLPKDFVNAFKGFLDAVTFPNEEHSFTLDGSPIALSEGLYFVLFLKKDASLDEVPSSLLEHGALLKLHLNKEGDIQEVAPSHLFSYPEFRKEVEDAKERFYLSEEGWKKLDSFLLYAQKEIAYAPDNIASNQQEDYSSAFLAMGGEVSECLDGLLSSFLLPVYYALDKKALLHLEPDLSSFLEDLLGEESIPESESLIHLEAHLTQEDKKAGPQA
jgi:hypothetical protein